MERADVRTRSSTRTSDLLDFLRHELAPTPERWHATLRLTLACVAATLPVMVFRLHLPLLVMILMYLITKTEKIPADRCDSPSHRTVDYPKLTSGEPR